MKDILVFIKGMFDKFGVWRAVSLILFSGIIVFSLLYGSYFFKYMEDLNTKKVNLPKKKDLYTHQLFIMYEMSENRLSMIKLKNEFRTNVVKDFFSCSFESERKTLKTLLDEDVEKMEPQEILTMVRISLDETGDCLKDKKYHPYVILCIKDILYDDVENYITTIKNIFDDELKKDKMYNVYKIKILMDITQRRWEQVSIKIKYEIDDIGDDFKKRDIKDE